MPGESPNHPRPDDPLIRSVADTLARVEANYYREGSGPGSRFEGQLLEDAQARVVVRMVSAELERQRDEAREGRNRALDRLNALPQSMKDAIREIGVARAEGDRLREALGRLVRVAWVEWAREQPRCQAILAG